jgi:exopolyphosphatase / guanosine-5'-triphosphate,3'-diphosphate pyrophosphatase
MPEAVPSGLAVGVEALMTEYETEPVHVLHVRDLAVSLFDDLQFLHRCGPLDRAILDAASCLHDIGWTVTQPDGKGHHKESARLIREHAWTEVSPAVVAMVSLVARYHRKSIPSEADHEAFAERSADERRRIRWLAGFLRIADGLDRRHIQATQRVRAGCVEGTVRIVASGVDGLDAEVLGARKKADLLAVASGLKIEVEAEG